MAERAEIKDDTSIVLPASVRAQAAAADAAFAAQFPTEGGEPEPVVAPELDPQALANPTPAPEPAPAPTPAPEPAVQEEGDWENRYKAMLGRFNKSQDEVRKLTTRILGLESTLAAMTAAPAAPEIPAFKSEKLVTEDEEREYGQDLLSVVGKKAREELAPVLAPLIEKLQSQDTLIKELRGGRAGDKTKDVLATLTEKLPNWEEVNTNPDFLAWLRLPDAYSGAIRHSLMDAAFAAGDASRVLAFFNGFLAEEAATAPKREITPAPGTTVVPKTQLVELAAPGKAKTAAASPTTPVEKPIITRAEIAQFYAAVAAGHYRGRDEQKARAEAEIFSAQQEGRIR